MKLSNLDHLSSEIKKLSQAERSQLLEEFIEYGKPGESEVNSGRIKNTDYYRAIFDASNDSVFIHDAKTGVVLDVNQTMMNTYGYSFEEVQNYDVGDLSSGESPYSRKEASGHIKKAIEEGPQRFDWLSKRKNGEVFWTEVSLRYFELNGEERVIAVVRDISNRKKIENQLEENAIRFEAIFNQSIQFLSILAEDGEILEVNDRVKELPGYGKEKIIGQNYCSEVFWNTEDAPLEDVNIALKIAQSGNVAEFNALETDENGIKHYTYNSITPIKADDGSILFLVAAANDITDQKNAEQETLDSEAKYKALFESANDSIFLMDEDLFIDCNKKTLELYNCTYDQIIGQPPYKFSPEMQPDGRSSQEKALEKITAAFDGISQFFEWKHTQYDGTPFDAEVSLNRVELKGKAYLLAIVRDITKRKAAEREIRKSQLFIQRIADTLPGVLFVFDHKEQRSIYTNRSILQALNYPEDQAKKMNAELLRKYIHPDDNIDMGEYVSRIAAVGPGGIFEHEYRIKAPDGKYRWFHNWVTSFKYDNNGIPLQSLGIAQDITERKVAEEENEKLATIIEAMPYFVGITSPDLKPIYINKAGRGMLGMGEDEDVTKYEISDMHPENSYEILEKEGIPTAIEEGTWTSELFLKKVDGSNQSIPIFQLLLVNKGDNSKLKFLSTVIMDISERIRLQEMMIQAEKMNTVGGLAAGMAHELNNPLGIILQSAQNLERRISRELPKNLAYADEIGLDFSLMKSYLDERGIHRYIEGIKDAGVRASTIINNMLGFSRKGEAVKRLNLLPEIVQNTVELAKNDYNLKKKFDFRKINIEYEFDSELPGVYCERSKIEQVLINLFKNAAQAMFSAEKKETPEITIRLFISGDKAVIEVEDNGPGMDTETKRHIFEPFFTTKAVGEGTGLGLSVSYFIIVEDHKGEIEVESEKGKGTKFSLKLPVM